MTTNRAAMVAASSSSVPVPLTSNIVELLTKYSSGDGVKLLQGYVLRLTQAVFYWPEIRFKASRPLHVDASLVSTVIGPSSPWPTGYTGWR